MERINAADTFDQDAYDKAERELADVDGKITRNNKLAEHRAASPAPATTQAPELRATAQDDDRADGGTMPVDGERRFAGSTTAKLRDPGHYRGAQGDHSWFNDQFRSWRHNDVDARARLDESDAYGLQWRAERANDPEFRDLTMATDTDGGALTPVMYMQDLHAELKRTMSPTLSICRRLPLPTGTDQISIPVMSTGSSVAVQSTENNALSETDIVWGTNVTASVWYTGGVQDFSLQLFEQSNPAIEAIVMRDLLAAALVDLGVDVLNGSGTNEHEGVLNADGIGTETYTAGTATFQGLYARLVALANDVHTAYYRPPTHFIMAPRRWAWMLAQVDGSNRPHLGFNPQNSAGNFEGLVAEGVVGNIMGVPVVADPNMPTTLGDATDEDRIIACIGSELLLFLREPKVEIDFSVGFRNNTVATKVNIPSAFTAERYPGAVSVMSGTGLNDTP